MIKKKYIFFLIIIVFISVFLCYTLYKRNMFERNYNEAIELINKNDLESYLLAKELLIPLGDYKNAYEQLYKINNCISIYEYANELLNRERYESAISELNKLNDFDNSLSLLNYAKYMYANQLYEMEEYEKSYQIFSDIENYRDSKIRADDALLQSTNEKNEQLYKTAINYKKNGDYSNALTFLNKIPNDYIEIRPDIPQLIQECNEELKKQEKYNKAIEFKNSELYIEAYNIFIELENYRDSASLARACWLKFAPYSLSATISAGLHHSVALNNDGKILCTDKDFKFETNNNDESENWDDIISISGFGTMVIGLKKDGSVVLEGHRDIDDKKKIDITSANVSDWKNIIQISTGQQHVAGLNKDGKILIRGLHIPGKSEIENWDNIIAIASGWADTIGLDSNGKVHYAGNSKNIDLEILESWNDIKSIAFGGGVEDKAYAGRGHIVVLHEDGSVSAVGDNECGQCDVDGEEWKDIIAIAAGDWHTVGLKSNGDVVSTHPSDNVINKYDLYTGACNVYGNDWHDIISISAGCGITLGLKDNGEIVSVGYSDYHNSRPESYEWNNIKNYKTEWDIMPPLQTTLNSEE